MSSKEFPPRVFGWVQDNGIPYGISDSGVVIGAPQEWISIQEHTAIVEAAVRESKEWEKLANDWREDYDKLKNKYEPMYATTGDADIEARFIGQNSQERDFT